MKEAFDLPSRRYYHKETHSWWHHYRFISNHVYHSTLHEFYMVEVAIWYTHEKLFSFIQY